MLGLFKQIPLIVLTTFVSVLINTSAQAQDDSDYLRNAIIEIQQEFSRLDNQYTNQANSDLAGLDAWVDDTELRWKASDFGEFDDQQVSFKVSLKNGKQINAERDILRMGEEKSNIKLSMLLENRLEHSYLNLIDRIEQEMRRSLLQQQRQIANADLSHWKSQVLTDNFRADKLQKADVSLDSIWAEELDNRAGLQRYQQQFSVNDIATRKVLSIPQIINQTENILQTGIYEQNNPLLRKAQLENGIANRQQQRSYAQGNLALKSVKLLYDNKDEAFGAEVGINIPLTKNSFELAQKRQSAYYASLDVENTRVEIAEQLKQKQFVLFRLQDEWSSNQRLMQKLKARIARVSQIGDPQLVLDLKTRQVSYQKRQNQILVRALKQYVSFLHSAGLLSATPYRNWLQVGTPRIL
jgi:hypothetical protein